MLTVSAGLAEESAILESVDLSKAEALGDEAQIDLRTLILSLISGETTGTDALSELPRRCMSVFFKDLRSTLPALMLPMLASMLLRMTLGKGNPGVKTAQFVCRASCIATLAAAFSAGMDEVRHLVETLMRCTDAFAPALIVVGTAVGTSSAAALTPLAAVLADVLENVIGVWGVALGAAAAGIAIAGNLSEHVRLKRLYMLFRQIQQWGAGVLMTGFFALLSLQGRVGVGKDTAMVRTARYAIENMVPVIGGNVSDSLDSLIAAAQAVRNALGTSGLVVMALLCAAPLGRITGMSLMLKFASALAEPIGDETMSAMLGQFAGAVEMLLIAAVAALVLCAMLVGSSMTAAIGSIQ